MEKAELTIVGGSRTCRVLCYGQGDQRVAIKMVSSLHKKESQLLLNEFRILQILDHPNIIKAFKCKEVLAPGGNRQITQLRHQQTALVLEFANHGSLLDYIQKQHPTLSTVKQFFLNIAQALSYAHSRSVAHRDIKLDNILVFGQKGSVMAKLSDFGLASVCRANGKQLKFNEFRGTERYMAPEIYVARENRQLRYDPIKADIFALGVVLFSMIFGRMPFEHAERSDNLYLLIMQKRYDLFWSFHGQSKLLESSPSSVVEHFRELFLKMVSVDPADRPNAAWLLSGHSFF